MSSEIEKVEISIQEAKKGVELRDKALRLADNNLFNEVVIEGYFKNESVRLTGLLGEPGMEDHQNSILTDLKAISAFQRYLRMIVQRGNMLEKEIMDLESVEAELRAEG